MKKIVCFYMSFVLTILFLSTVYAESSWGQDELKEAIDIGIVPDSIKSDYDKLITREEFCELAYSVVKSWGFVDFDNVDISNVKFDDTNNEKILKCAALNIITGIGNNKFAPNSPIKRQEAARMLYNTIDSGSQFIMEAHFRSYGNLGCCVPHSFDDGGKIMSWARNEITHLYRYGVMFGVSEKNFDPNGGYTRKQAICSFLRLYRCYGSLAANSLPESDYYPLGKTAADYDDNYKSTFALYYNKDEYSAQYIDNNFAESGKIYNQSEKGYVYPFGTNYGKFQVSVGAGVSASSVVDKYGNVCISDVNNGSIYDLEITNESAIVFNYDVCRIYDIASETPVFINDGGSILDITGNGVYAFDKNGKMGVVNIDGKIIFNPEYEICYPKSHNDTFILKDGSENYYIAKTDGTIQKKFNVDKDWEFISSFGSNIIFSESVDNINYKYVLYRAYSEKYYDGFDDLYFTDNGELIGYKNINGKNNYYILNLDGTVKFDAAKEGYEYVSYKSNGLYKAIKNANSEEYMVNSDIVGVDGKIIKTDVGNAFDGNNEFVVDKSGICAYAPDKNTIIFFDFYGEELGTYRFEEGITYNEQKITALSGMKFINGLLWIVGETSDAEVGNYLLPSGTLISNIWY